MIYFFTFYEDKIQKITDYTYLNIVNIVWMLSVNLIERSKNNIKKQKNLPLANNTITSCPDIRKKMWLVGAKNELKL